MSAWDISYANGENSTLHTNSGWDQIAIDASHILIAWDYDWSVYRGRAEVIEFNTSTWNITKKGTCDFQESAIYESRLAQIDSAHYAVLYRDAAGVAIARVLAVDSGNWSVSVVGSAFDVASEGNLRVELVVKLDATHYLFCWCNKTTSPYHRIRVAEISTSTWNWSWAGSELSYYTSNASEGLGCAEIDSTHYILSYGYYGRARVLQVNTSTWELTWPGSEFTTTRWGTARDHLRKIDSTHFLKVLREGYYGIRTEILSVNTGTWALTSEQTTDNLFSNTSDEGPNFCDLGDGIHFQVVWQRYSPNRYTYTQTIKVNTSDWSVSALGSNTLIKAASTELPLVALLNPTGSNGHSCVSCFGSDTIYYRAFEIQGPVTVRKYLNFFANAAGTQYDFLNTDTKAALVVLHDVLVSMEQVTYGGFPLLNTEAKASGYGYRYLKTDITEIDCHYTKFKNLISDVRGAVEIFSVFGAEIRAAYISFKHLSGLMAARWMLDTDIPYLKYDFYPANNAKAISPNTPILMKIADVGMGVKLDTFFCKVNSVQYNYGDSEVKVYPMRPPFEYLFAVKPGFLGWNKEITVDVYCEDKYGNPGLNKEIL